MLFCVPDIAILFISLLSCKHANFVIKNPLLGHIHIALPSKSREKKKKSVSVPQDFINYEINLRVNRV